MISNATRDNIILKGHKNQVRGEFLDVYLRANYADMAHVDAIISREEDPEGTTFKLKAGERDTDVQDRCGEDLLDRYGASLNNYEWCPITRAWYGCENENIIAARLVSYNMGEVNCDHLFGPPDKGDEGTHLFSPSNGLPMHGTFKRALDTGCIIIVPALKGGPRS
jgi:hypothetical protein